MIGSRDDASEGGSGCGWRTAPGVGRRDRPVLPARRTPAARRTDQPNQARYGPAHVRRLALVQALTEVAGLSVAAVRDVLTAIDEPDSTLHDVLTAQPGLPVAPCETVSAADREWAARRIDEVAAERGRQPPISRPSPDWTRPRTWWRAR
ncbi:MerR family transcriptional regulator [Nocardia grenadensis]